MIKYGKKSADILGVKQTFFEENSHHLNKNQRIRDLYIAQPARDNCKNCETPLGEVDFTTHKVPFSYCPKCGHLNGRHEDTNEFCANAYTSDDGAAYSENYQSSDIKAFETRVQNIYTPKAEFLLEALGEGRFNFADFGAGTGYFAKALLSLGQNVQGFEVSKAQVDLGNKLIGQEVLVQHDLEKTKEILKETNAQVVSMIGVLEHLQNPRECLKSISENSNIEYFYLSVPLMSFCVYLELFFPENFNRQLGGTHTHLYTESSIDHFCSEFGFEKKAQWWFGTDFVDLFRHGQVELGRLGTSAKAQEEFSKILAPQIDDLQLSLDKKHLSSEVHMLLARKN